MVSRIAVGRRTSLLPRFAVACVALALGSLAVTASPAAASAACSTQQLSVQPLQSSVFYVDAATDYLGSYVGFRLTNTGVASRSRLWERLEHFQGGVIAPAAGGTATPAVPVDALAAGASSPSYAYLTATGGTSTAQSYDVVLYDGRPGAGGTELCRVAQSVSSVQDVIKAAANKVTSAVLAPAAATLGGTFDLTVTGSTGTIGAGIASDPGVVRFSPAVAATWPSSAFRLVGVTSQFPTGSAGTADLLSLGGMSGADRAYTITYRFRVVGPTASATPVVPVQNIASGTQVKHTDPGTLGTLAPIPQVTSDASLAVAAGGSAPYVAGAGVPLTATVTNDAANPISLDEVVLHLPAGWTAAPGTATAGGAATADPYDAGSGGLHLIGPFTVPAHGTYTVGLSATAGPAGSSGAFTATATLAGGQIDATKDPSDDVPASVTLAVLGAPTAADDTLSAATGQTTALDVLANDDTAFGAPVLTVLTGPGHGTAGVAGDHLTYTPDPGYSGPDTLTYRLTTPGGSDDATVDVTVAAPPVPPTPADLTSTGVGVAPQTQTLAIPAGGTVRLIDAGTPVTTLTTPGEGTYVLDPATGVVTFTAVLGFTGAATPAAYRATDTFAQHADATYTPSVTTPPLATPAPRTSTGVGTAQQSAALPIPAGGSVRLLDGATEVLTRTVPDEGLYVLDPATGEVSFTPAAAFHGAATVATFRIRDAYGQTAESTYAPTVTLPPAPAPAPLTSTGVGTAPQSRTLTVPAGGAVTLLDADGRPQTSVTVPDEGRYELASGTVTFTPVLGFHGPGAGVGYRAVDVYGQSGDAAYVPTVTSPAAPPVTDVTSTGEGTAPQSRQLAVPNGGTVTLLDATGQPVSEVVVAGQGTYRLDPATDTVTFTPALGFAGAPTPVAYRVTDAYGQRADALYLPAVTPPPAPDAAPASSTGRPAAAQAVTLAVPPAGSITLLDADGTPATRVTVAGVGTYVLDPAAGTITFTPEAGYVGTPHGVRYRVLDAYAQGREATYVPSVVAVAFTDPPAAATTPTVAAPASCSSLRLLTIHWKIAHGVRLRRQVLTIVGQRARRLATSVRAAPIDMRGLSARTVVISVRATAADGRTFRALRTFHTCRPRLIGPPLTTLSLHPRPQPR